MPSTKDHEQIKSWARQRHASPAIVKDTDDLLRFDFDDPQEAEDLRPINWDKFFEIFDERGIELVFDEKPESRFHKFTYTDK